MADTPFRKTHLGGCVLHKRLIGQTGIEVSPIGLGTVKFGRNQGVRYPLPFEIPSDAVLHSLLSTAASLGINLIDTAPAYGESEARLGKLLKPHRDNWVISTKVGEAFIDGQSYFDFSPHAVRSSIEQSLKHLATDYLDIVLVHSNGDDEHIIETENVFETLAALKQAGLIRAFGMSTKTVAGGLLTVDHADLVMVTHNPNYTEERDVITYANQHQKGIFIKKALQSGHISTSVADNLQFIFKEPGISSVIIGTINEAHLRENLAAIYPDIF